MLVLLKYKQRESKPDKIIDSFGGRIIVSQCGVIDYDQEEEIEALEVPKRIKELKSFSNRHYHSFNL